MSETEVTTEVQVDDTDNLDTFASDFFGEKKEAAPANAKSVDAKQDVEQEEVESEGEGKTDAQEAELTDEDEAKAEAELAAQPKKSKVQERIDELVKQREEAKRNGDAQIAALRKEFEEKLAALQPKTPEPKSAEPTPDATNEDGSAKYPLGEFDPTYIRDLTRFTLNQERVQADIKAEAERQTQQEQTAKAALHQSWQEKVAASQTKYTDFNEKGQELLDGFNNLDPAYADYLGTVLMSMDYGPDVLYYLSNNRDEATKIVNSGAQKATLALGRIEAKFAEIEAQKLVAKPKLSKAPPPPSASARGTGGGAKTIEADTDDLDAFTAEFFRKRR
jgi:chemotaxis protein histidine kinase CheA